jgi:hypothetical protein
MRRLPIFALALTTVVLLGAGSGDSAFSGEVRGRVLSIRCPGPTAKYFACSKRALEARVDVIALKVDGSVAGRSISTTRAGRFRVSLTPGYYVFWARPPRPGMSSMPVQITVPPEGTTINLEVENRLY